MCQNSTDCILFDSDVIEAILKTGASRTLTHDRSDFIEYEECTGKVEGLGAHPVVGIGTVRYVIKNDEGTTTEIILKNSIHVPTLNVRLIILQQFAQQYADVNANGKITGNNLKLSWDSHTKTVPYQVSNNLPILFTNPGNKIADAYISKHMCTWNKAYFEKDADGPKWNKNLQLVKLATCTNRLQVSQK